MLNIATNWSLSALAQSQDAALRAGIDAVVGNGLGMAAQLLKYLVIVYIVICFSKFSWGRMGGGDMTERWLRAAIVAFLIGNQANYTDWVVNLFFTQIPDAIASVLTGGTALTAPQQYDVVSQAIDNLVATVRAHNTGWSVSAFSNAIATWFYAGGMHLVLAVIGAVWLLGETLMAIVICFGPWLLCCELFDRTRNLVSQWIGVLVGLSVFQLGSSILIQIMLRGIMSMLVGIKGDIATAGADQMVADLLHGGVYILVCAIAMVALPMVCAIGSGVAAVNATGTSFVLGLPGKAAGAAGKVRTLIRAARA